MPMRSLHKAAGEPSAWRSCLLTGPKPSWLARSAGAVSRSGPRGERRPPPRGATRGYRSRSLQDCPRRATDTPDHVHADRVGWPSVFKLGPRHARWLPTDEDLRAIGLSVGTTAH